MKIFNLIAFTTLLVTNAQAQTPGKYHDAMERTAEAGVAASSIGIGVLGGQSIYLYRKAAKLKKARSTNLLSLSSSPQAITENQIAKIRGAVFDGNVVEIRFIPSESFLRQHQLAQRNAGFGSLPRNNLLDAEELKSIKRGIINTRSPEKLEQTLSFLRKENVKIISIEKYSIWAEESISNLRVEGQFVSMGAGFMAAFDLVSIASLVWITK